MKKRNLILLIGGLVLIFSSITVFASFVFHKIVNMNASTGNIKVDEMYFGDYSENSDGEFIDTTAGEFISCYATKKHGWSGEEDYIYLNQLSLKFSYTTTIDVYVRIHIEDAWLSTKTYTNGIVSTTYIEKDKIEGKSPFEPNDTTNWVYDESTNCIYYKYKVSIDEKENVKKVHEEFKLNSEYFYLPSQSTSYREHVIVHVSYYVDIVQANRAEKIWQVDFEDLGIK